MRVGLIKKTGFGLLVASVLTIFASFLGVGYASAVTPDWDTNDNANLNPSHQNATNPGFTKSDRDDADCGTPPQGAAGDWGWYFVLPAGKSAGADTIVTLDVNFDQWGFHKDVAFTHPGKTWKAVVWTPTSDTLLDAKAYTTTQTSAGPGEFNLSHVCAGTTTNSSSSSDSTSSSSTSSSSSSDSTSSSSSESTSSSSSESTSSSSSESTSSSSSESTSSSSSESTSSSSSESTSSSSSVLDTSSSTSTSSSSSEVLATESTNAPNPTVLGVEVTRDTLPRTGIDPSTLLAVGLLFALVGAMLVGGADRLARRTR